MVDAENRILEVLIVLQCLDFQALELAKLLDPYRTPMRSEAVIRRFGPKVLGDLLREHGPIVPMAKHVAFQPSSDDLLRELDLLAAELQEAAGIAAKNGRPCREYCHIVGDLALGTTKVTQDCVGRRKSLSLGNRDKDLRIDRPQLRM